MPEEIPRETRKGELFLALVEQHPKTAHKKILRALSQRGYQTDGCGSYASPSITWKGDVARPSEYATRYFREYERPDISDIEVESEAPRLREILEK
jgi:hypothetical protein